DAIARVPGRRLLALEYLGRAVVVAHGHFPLLRGTHLLLDLVAEQRAARGAEHRDELVVVADVVAEPRAGDTAAHGAHALGVAFHVDFTHRLDCPQEAWLHRRLGRFVDLR